MYTSVFRSFLFNCLVLLNVWDRQYSILLSICILFNDKKVFITSTQSYWHVTAVSQISLVNTLKTGQIGGHFADDIFKCIFLNENFFVLIKIFIQQKKTKFTVEHPYILLVLYYQYHVCWCPGDFRSQGISRHGIYQISWNILSLAEELIHVLYIKHLVMMYLLFRMCVPQLLFWVLAPWTE